MHSGFDEHLPHRGNNTKSEKKAQEWKSNIGLHSQGECLMNGVQMGEGEEGEE